VDELGQIQLASQGSLEAFNELVLVHQDRLYNQAYRILGEPGAAEDAVQEAFLTAFLKLSSFRGGSFKAWLLRIVSNLCYDHMRRERVRPTVALEIQDAYGEEIETSEWLEDPGLTPPQASERKDFWDGVQRSLDRLNPEYRLAVVLVDIQELDYAEAAQAMGTSIGTLKSRLVRGRLKMRELLDRDGAGLGSASGEKGRPRAEDSRMRSLTLCQG
jgi:RNA polymerase sigma-70 factor, ECF subfamily